jgi:hypothetical protein
MVACDLVSSAMASTSRWRSVSRPSSRFSFKASPSRNLRARARPQRRWLRSNSPTVMVETSHGQPLTTSAAPVFPTAMFRLSAALARRTRFASARARMCCGIGAGATDEAASILTPPLSGSEVSGRLFCAMAPLSRPRYRVEDDRDKRLSFVPSAPRPGCVWRAREPTRVRRGASTGRPPRRHQSFAKSTFFVCRLPLSIIGQGETTQSG